MKKAVLKNLTIFTGMLQTCNFIKKRLQHRYFPVLSSEYFEIFKNTYFEEHLLTAASDFFLNSYRTPASNCFDSFEQVMKN